MQVNEIVSDGLKREYGVVVPASDMTQRIDSRLDELRRKANLRGFRPGKVPLALLKQRFGKSVVSDVLREALEDSTGKVIAEKSLRPALQPRVEAVNFDEGQDLEYRLALEVMPRIELGDVSSIELERLAVEITDEAIEERVALIVDRSRSYGEAEPDHAARPEDRLRIDWRGRLDGEAFEGGEAEDQHAVIGSGTLPPQLEESLIGRKAGESFRVDVDFPEDHGVPHLAGRTAVFEVAVKAVECPDIPVLDDDFARRQGADDVESFKRVVRDLMAEDYEGLARRRLKRGLLDRLSDTHDFELPPTLVDNEFRAIWGQLEKARGSSGEEGGEEGEEPGSAEGVEAMREEYRGIARRRVRLGLLLAEVGRLNDIRLTDDDMRQAVIEAARRHPGQETKVVEHYRQHPEALQGLTAPMLEDRVVDHLLTQAKVGERSLTSEAFLALLKAEDDDSGPAPADTPAAAEAGGRDSPES